MYDVVIIGAGPAGLSAAHELSSSTKNILIIEKQKQVGGLAQTKVFDKYRYDIGPHRFFTKNEEVNKLFLDMLADDAVKVSRKTRILFKGSYFDYPLTPINALFGLGILESIRIGFSYIYARVKSYLKISKIEFKIYWNKNIKTEFDLIELGPGTGTLIVDLEKDYI